MGFYLRLAAFNGKQLVMSEAMTITQKKNQKSDLKYDLMRQC